MKKIAIVTGANSGLGYETSLGLVKENFHVVMACRNISKADSAKSKLLKEISTANLEIIPLDLADFISVRNFVTLFNQKHQHIHLLVNNAGLMDTKSLLTKDGFESNIGTNYLGHFLLTKLLFPVISQTINSKIISVSSIAHRFSNTVFTSKKELNGARSFKAYSQSKLACLMFSYELQRRLDNNAISVVSNCAHPGISVTSIGKKLPGVLMKLQDKFGLLAFSKPEQGVLPILHVSLDSTLKGGQYFGPDGLFEIKGNVKKVDSNSISKNIELAKKLWTLSEELTGGVFEI